MTTDRTSATPAARRQRKCRELKRRGLVVLRIAAPLGPLADALIESGWLQEWDAENAIRVAEALEQMLTHMADEHVTRDYSS